MKLRIGWCGINISKKQAMIYVRGYGIALDYLVKGSKRHFVLFVFGGERGDRALWKATRPVGG